CSPGTYVRSLAHDLGARLGCGAHLESLRRLRSGEFNIDQSVPLANATRSDVVTLERLLSEMPRMDVSGVEEDRARHGNPIRTELTAGPARIFNTRGEFLAVASVERGWARPQFVLTSKTGVEPAESG